MSGLHRTPLTTSQKVKCAAQALAGQECHETVSALSREFEISRPSVYEARAAAAQPAHDQIADRGGDDEPRQVLLHCLVPALA